MTDKRKVLIVGGGIAGPVLGIALRRLGAHVEIAEQRGAAVQAEGAFLGVAPNGMNVLAELGVADAVAARGEACSSFEFLNERGQSIGEINRREDATRFGSPLVMIRRSHLHEVLLAEAIHRGVVVHRGRGLRRVALEQHGAPVAEFDDGARMDADLLVGGDGIRSTVRSLTFPDAPSPVFSGLYDYGGFARGVSIPAPPGVNLMVFGRRAFFGAFATGTGEVWWFHNGPAEARDGAHTALQELHAADPSWIGDVIRATPAILGPWPLHELPPLPHWSRGPVVLLGDAAHAMSPSAGQGASLAMEDALVLAKCLRDVPDVDAALRAYERLRKPRVEPIARLARRNGSGKVANGVVQRWFRDRLLPVFLRLGGSAQDRGYAFRIRWDDALGVGAAARR